MRESPSLKAAILLALGIAVAYWHTINPFHLLSVLSVILIASFLPPLRRFHNACIATLLILTGSFAYIASLPPEPHFPVFLTARGIVSEPPISREKRATFPLQLVALEKPDGRLERASGSLWVVGELDSLPELGWETAITGVLEPFPEQRNPGQFDLRRYRRADGMIGRLKFDQSSDVRVVSREKSLMLSLRSKLDAVCDSLGRWDAPLWKGLLLGFRRDLDPDLVEQLRVTGLTHLLALSGLNIGFLAVALLGLLALYPLSPSKRAIPALIIVILYTLLIPDRGATVRASLMVSTALLGRALHRWTSPINSIGLAALLALIYRPGDLFDAGFQMSFAATIAILLFHPEMAVLRQQLSKAGRWMRLGARWLMIPFLISLVSSIAVAPLTAYHFFGIPLAGPLFNLWAVPIMGLIYAGAWISVFLYPLHIGLAHLVADGVLILGFWWRGLVSFSAAHAPIWEGFLPPVAILAMFATLIWMAISKRSLRARCAIGLPILLLAAIFGSLPNNVRSPQIWFLDVGHGDASIWKIPGGGVVVVDGGPEATEQGRGVVTSALRRINTERVSLLVGSHLEADHIGGLPDVIHSFPVGLALLGGGNLESDAAKRLTDALALQNTPIELPPSSGLEVVGFQAGLSVKILGRPAQKGALSANNSSLSMMLHTVNSDGSDLSFLTCGDLEATGERYVARQGNIHAQLLKASHHGSATSSTPEFLAAVRPDDIVITRSSLNERGSPEGRRIVLSRYKEAGIRVHRIDREGALLFRAAENGWERVDWRHPSYYGWMFGRMG